MRLQCACNAYTCVYWSMVDFSKSARQVHSRKRRYACIFYYKIKLKKGQKEKNIKLTIWRVVRSCWLFPYSSSCMDSNCCFFFKSEWKRLTTDITTGGPIRPSCCIPNAHYGTLLYFVVCLLSYPVNDNYIMFHALSYYHSRTISSFSRLYLLPCLFYRSKQLSGRVRFIFISVATIHDG